MSGWPSLRIRIAAGPAALLLGGALCAHAPHDVTSELALSPNFGIDQTVFATVTLSDNYLFVRSTDAGRSWTYIGTPMAAAAPDGFAFSPGFAVDRTAFAANPASGMWRTQDGGLTWQPANVGITTLVVRGVAVSPKFAVDRRVLAATNAGVFMSQDGGDTWTPSNDGLSEVSVRRVAMTRDPGGGVTAFVAGIAFHRSVDGGLHWTETGTFSRLVESLAVSPFFAQDLRVAVSFGRGGLGVAHSHDGGNNFQDLNNGLSDLFVEEVDIAPDGSMFAATDTQGCFRLKVPEGPWQLIVQGFEEPSDQTEVHNTEIVASPDFLNDHTVFAGAWEGMYRSIAGGDDWRQLNIYSQLLNRRFVLPPHYETDHDLLVGNYGGGVFHYTEHLQSPQPPTSASGGGGVAGGGMGSTSSTSAATHKLGGSGSPVPLFEWEHRATGLVSPYSSALVASPGEPGKRLLLFGYLDLLKSTDEGLHWVSANKPPSVEVVRELGVSPQFDHDGTAFLGSGKTGAYRSTDGCQTWELLPDLPVAMATTSIGVSAGFTADGTVFYSSRDFGVWRSLDRGDSFTQVNNGLPTTNIETLALSPDFVADRLVLLGTNNAGIWRSPDAGATWLDANAGLPDGPARVETIAFSPAFAVDHTVFVGMQDQGVWRSINGGLSWDPTGPGMVGPPFEIAVSTSFAEDGIVFVGTFGGTCVSHDAGESWQPMPGYVRADDKHPAVHYEGAWTVTGAEDEFAGTLHTAGNRGALTELEFFGERVTWFTQRRPDGAIAAIQIDEEPPVLADTWQAIAEPQVAAFTRKFHEPGWHVIRVVHSGTANPSSSGFSLSSDGFEYTW